MGWAIEATVVMGLCSFFIYLYFFKKGQFDHSEEIKYLVFREEDQGDN